MSPASPASPASISLSDEKTFKQKEALLEAIKSGAVAPLRGSYIVKLWKSGGRVLPRQQLPPKEKQLRQRRKSRGSVPLPRNRPMPTLGHLPMLELRPRTC